MGFVNEYISAADIEKYRIRELDDRFMKGHYKPQWTVDSERDMYLRYMTKGREELSGSWTFYFFWKGVEVVADLYLTPLKDDKCMPVRNYRIRKVQIAEAALEFRDQILTDLKEALSAFKDMGVLTKPGKFSVTFDF